MTNTKKVITKNITITLTSDEYEQLNDIVDYFQEQSISNVSKADVIKFMIDQFKEAIDNNQLEAVRNLIKDIRHS